MDVLLFKMEQKQKIYSNHRSIAKMNKNGTKKVRHSGHFVDQKLKCSDLKDCNFLKTLSGETQQKIHLCALTNIRAEGIRLTPPQDKLLNAILKLLHDKSENRNIESEQFYAGNAGKEMVPYGGKGQIARSSVIRIIPSELYKAYMDSSDYSGADIKFIKNLLSNTEQQKFLIIYERRRELKNEKGKKEIRIDRIEDFQSLFKIIRFFEGLTEEEAENLDNGNELLRDKKGELVIALNPLLTDQINSKYVEYPSDINKRTVIAAGGHKFVTESMLALRDYMLRELSARRFHSEINEEKLFLVLKLENYIKSRRRKIIQQRAEDAIQVIKNLGLLEDYERVIGAAGQWKYIFHLNSKFT